MPSLRMLRLANSLETGAYTGTTLETLLTTKSDVLGEFRATLKRRAFSERFAANSTAMNTIVASSTAMAAVANSSTAMTAVTASSTAMNAVTASSTAMATVGASSTAMGVITASSTTLNSVTSNSTAMNAIGANSTAMRNITTSYLSFWLGRLFPSCGGYLAGYIDTNTSTRYYYFAAPRANSGQTTSGIPYYGYGTDQAGLVNIGSYTWPGLTSTGIIDGSAASGTGFNGQANTAALYAAGDTTSANAGGFAKTRSVTLGSSTFTDYFLGSVYEMDMCYRNATSFNTNAGSSEQWDMTQTYWTSNENPNNPSAYSLSVSFANIVGSAVGSNTKGTNYFVRGLRKFTI